MHCIFNNLMHLKILIQNLSKSFIYQRRISTLRRLENYHIWNLPGIKCLIIHRDNIANPNLFLAFGRQAWLLIHLKSSSHGGYCFSVHPFLPFPWVVCEPPWNHGTSQKAPEKSLTLDTTLWYQTYLPLAAKWNILVLSVI